MTDVTLRAVAADDLPALAGTDAAWGEQFEFFGFPASNGYQRWYAESGCLSEKSGLLVVEVDGSLVGRVTWHVVEYGPGSNSNALRVGIALLPDARGRGIGAEAQRTLSEYLFSTTTAHRIEAGADIENLAEQRSLEKAGFTRDGLMREAQFRDGKRHDIVVFSRLRTDP